MDRPDENPAAPPAPAAPWTSVLAWWIPALALSIGAARLAVSVQATFAPVVVFPLILGVVVGGISSALLTFAGVERRTLALVGTFLLGLATIGAEHYFFYLDHVGKLDAAAEKAAVVLDDATFRPSFLDFVSKQATNMNLLNWWFHGLLVLLASMAIVAWRLPAKAPASQDQSPPETPPANLDRMRPPL